MCFPRVVNVLGQGRVVPWMQSVPVAVLGSDQCLTEALSTLKCIPTQRTESWKEILSVRRPTPDSGTFH